MTLVLQIENYDVLEDGGPAQVTVSERGCQVGRASSMDWVLPDASRHISSHHFDIVHQDGAYWLRDVSTNGTFLQGQRYRIEGAHRLSHMERFQVGHYIIMAQIGGAQPLVPPPPTSTWSTEPAPGSIDDSDPWAVGGVFDPVNPHPPDPNQRFDDFADDFIATPQAVPPATSPPPSPMPASVPAPVPGPPDDVPLAPPGTEFAPPPPSVPMPSPASVQQPPIPAAPPPPIATPHPDASPVPTGPTDLVRAFCEGAGLSPEAYADVPPEELARMLGQSLRVVSAEVMTMLQARAEAKYFTRGGERTQRRQADNNPLKFLPDADQAMEAMFLKYRAGFLTGPDGLTEALRDVRLHQAAVFAAIQPALAALVADLAPEVIEEATSGSVLGSGKRGKSWDAYVARWDAKTSPHENGILDEFLLHFAKAYADMVGPGKGPEGGIPD